MSPWSEPVTANERSTDQRRHIPNHQTQREHMGNRGPSLAAHRRDATTAFVQRITNVTMGVWVTFLPLVIFQFMLTDYIEDGTGARKASSTFVPV